MERYLKSKLEGGSFGRVDPARSLIMASIKGKSNKSTELTLRLVLVRAGVRGWRTHASELPGRPDFYFDDARLAVFVDGCYWHGCWRCGHVPKTRSEFWSAKFERNRARDAHNNRRLRHMGIIVIRVWEHSLKTQLGRRQVLRRIDAKRYPEFNSVFG